MNYHGPAVLIGRCDFAGLFVPSLNPREQMHRLQFFLSISTFALAALLAGGCTQRAPVIPPQQPPKPQVEPPPANTPPPAVKIDPMADVPGDKPLPAMQGAVEQIDCKTGEEYLHARMALEAHGGQVTSFAYYSVWKPRTCSLDFERNAARTKWRLTPDGAIRVHTPDGRFLIRTLPDAYVFEFEQVQRQRFCGMYGEINGSMTIKRNADPPVCSVIGIMDANDEYLEHLRKLK
jgi:hypothetical protein